MLLFIVADFFLFFGKLCEVYLFSLVYTRKELMYCLGIAVNKKLGEHKIMQKVLLTMKELQEYTGFSRQKVIYFIKCNLLPYINISEGEELQRYRFNIESVNEFLIKIQKNMFVNENCTVSNEITNIIDRNQLR